MRNSKDYIFIVGNDIKYRAALAKAYPDRQQSSDCCKFQEFYLFEKDEPEAKILLESISNKRHNISAYQAIDENLELFIEAYWDGEINWDNDTELIA